MSNNIVKGIAVAAALSVGALAIASPAEARHRGRNLAIGAALGLGAAAIIAGSQRRHDYYGYQNYDYRPRPYYYAPPPVAYVPSRAYSYRPAPWTPAWYRYCSSKYISFDARSGTFQPYVGPRRLCV